MVSGVVRAGVTDSPTRGPDACDAAPPRPPLASTSSSTRARAPRQPL